MFLMVKNTSLTFCWNKLRLTTAFVRAYIYCVAQLPGSRLFTFEQHKNYITAM